MLKFVRNAALAATLSLAFAAPGHAQTVDTSAVEAACIPAGSTEAACLAAVEAFIASLAGLPVAEADAALGELATALATGSLSDGANAITIAAALEATAAAVSDTAQASAIASLAVAVATGEELPVFAIEEAVPASPA